MNKQEFANAIHGVTEAVKDRKDYGRIASLERQHQVAHELAMSQGGHCGQ